jgi:hypothetical protein
MPDAAVVRDFCVRFLPLEGKDCGCERIDGVSGLGVMATIWVRIIECGAGARFVEGVLSASQPIRPACANTTTAPTQPSWRLDLVLASSLVARNTVKFT